MALPSSSQASGPLPEIDNVALLDALTVSSSIQEALGLGQPDLLRRLNRSDWSADNAFKECELPFPSHVYLCTALTHLLAQQWRQSSGSTRFPATPSRR